MLSKQEHSRKPSDNTSLGKSAVAWKQFVWNELKGCSAAGLSPMKKGKVLVL